MGAETGAVAPDQTVTPRRMWWTLIAMCFALFMIMLDNTVVNVALPTMQRDLAMTPSGLQWVLNAYVLVFAALILLGGKLGDRFGRRRMFLVGLVSFTVWSAACALAQTSEQLILFRALQGTGAALMNPLSLSILVATFPRPRLPQAIGIWAGISGLGLALGPLLGGFLTDTVGWAAIFWINVPIGLIALVVVLLAVRESTDPTVRSLDVVGTILVTAGLFLVVYGIIGTGDHGWTSPRTLLLLGVAVALLLAFVVWESRQDQPMVPLGFFRSRVFSTSIIVAVLVGFGLFGSIYVITLYMQNIQGYDAIGAGIRTLPITLAVLVVSPLAGRLNARLGPARLMGTGMALAAIAMFGLRLLEVDSPYSRIWPFYIALGVGLALTMPAMSAAAMGAIDPRKAGVGSGVLNAARQVGGAIGIAVLGSIAAAVTARRWTDATAELGPPLSEQASTLGKLVEGAQGALIEAAAGPQAVTLAFAAWMDGFHASVLIGGLLMVLAVGVVIVGMRGVARAVPAYDSSDLPPPAAGE